MNTTARTPDERARLIANAALQPLVMTCKNGRIITIRPTVLKAVLISVWNHEHKRVPIQRLADESGCGLSTAFRAVRCMICDGMLIEVEAGTNNCAGVYAVSDERLIEYAANRAA